LDRLSESDRRSAKDRDLSRLASRGSFKGFAATRFAVQGIEAERQLKQNGSRIGFSADESCGCAPE
jgi:hypothetical protein